MKAVIKAADDIPGMAMMPVAIREIVAQSKADAAAVMGVAMGAAMMARMQSGVPTTPSFAPCRTSATQSRADIALGRRTTLLLAMCDMPSVPAWVMAETAIEAALMGLSDEHSEAIAAGGALGACVLDAHQIRTTTGLGPIRSIEPRVTDGYHCHHLIKSMLHPEVEEFVRTLKHLGEQGRDGIEEVIRRAIRTGMVTVPGEMPGATSSMRRITGVLKAWMVSDGAVHDFTGSEALLRGWRTPMPGSWLVSDGCRYLHLGDATPAGWEGAFVISGGRRMDGFPEQDRETAATALLMPAHVARDDDEIGYSMRMVATTMPVAMHHHDTVDDIRDRIVREGCVDGLPGASIRSLGEMIETVMKGIAHIR